MYYNDRWQVVEEQISGVTKMQYVWTPAYVESTGVDVLLLRDRDADADSETGDHGLSGSGLEQRRLRPRQQRRRPRRRRAGGSRVPEVLSTGGDFSLVRYNAD